MVSSGPEQPPQQRQRQQRQQQQQQQQRQPAKIQTPRKRRRRTVVSGAPDDCFTCSKQGEKCDRRRPYCSKCLENGRECSGYKMNLTWGVGVASRGKMRGLSQPVLGAQPAGIPPKPQQKLASSKGSSGLKRPLHHPPPPPPSTSSTQQQQQQQLHQNPQGPDIVALSGQSAMDPLASTTANMTPAPATPAVYPFSENDFSSPSSAGDIPGGGDPLAFRMPNHSAYSSPHQQVAQDVPVSEFSPYPGLYQPAYYPLHEPALQSWAGLAPASVSTTTATSTANMEYVSPSNVKSENEDSEDEIFCQRRESAVSHGSGSSSIWAMNQSPSYSQLLLARSVGRTPRLKYLISYYAEVIAPVIIAFGGSTNPFRNHMLRLAQDSEALQEAIATLSSSNLRERRDRRSVSTGRTLPSRMSSVAHRALTEGGLQGHYDSSSDGIAREVVYHRAMAVKALNADLANPRRRLSDSVLGALLILCLFHACDTGVAKYKDHFAGVRKLLALRLRHSKGISDELKWFIRMFTFFDTITAAMNDHESQLEESCLDISAVSDGEWPLENLAGCDAGLFRLVAQIGRLNLLNQSKSIQTPAPSYMFMPMAPLPPSMLQYPPVTTETTAGCLPLSRTAVNNYGFALPPTPPLVEEVGQAQHSPPTAFWTEWFSLRQKLESWRLDPSLYGNYSTTTATAASPPFSDNGILPGYISPRTTPPIQSQIAPENLQDIFHISESFRHAAILYCERLAYPSLPSSNARFQTIVRVAMHHISAVQSDVYLLWPVFIVGSECVDESHRAAIRNRCSDISNDSGFCNNLSCLAVLERVWAQNLDSDVQHQVGVQSPSPPPSSSSSSCLGYPGDWNSSGGSIGSGSGLVLRRRHGFTWHSAMQEKRADGEYLVA